MTNTGNKVYNIFINSANRSSTDKPYDFSVFFDNDEITVNGNEGVNINIASFSLLNSMYNVNEYTGNNKFKVRETVDNHHTDLSFTIPFGNYNVLTFMNELNNQLSGIIKVSYNVATNTYTYTNLTSNDYKIMPLNCIKLLGLSETTSILTTGTVSSYVNMVNYQQVILRCPTLVFESNSMDNIQDKDNFIAVSDILYWINKQDVEPFKTINYKNEDCGTLYSYNVVNRNFSNFNFKLVNEFNEPIYDAPDFLLQLQITVYDKDNTYFKEASLQILKLLNDIYFTVLNIVSLLIKK
jgi:hypothetical protein